MALYELIEYLKQHHIKLDVVENNLSISATNAQLSDALISQIKQYKPQLIAYLNYKSSAITQTDSNGQHHALSFAQRRLYFLYQYQPDTTHFNLPVELTIEPSLDPQAFHQALLQVLKQQPILSTVYGIDAQGSAFSHYDVKRPADYEFIDQSSAEPQQCQDERQRIIKEVCLQPFDLHQDLPLRTRLIKRPDHHYSLFMVFHHIATDDWSIKLFLDELRQNYRAVVEQIDDIPPASALRYTDFAHWQNHHHSQGCFEVAKSYWQHYFADVSGYLPLPLDKKRPNTQQFTNGFMAKALPKGFHQQLNTRLQGYNVSPYVFHLSTLNLLLSKLTSEQDIVVGVDTFGRDHHALDKLQGFFVNQLALRSRLNRDETFESYLQQVNRDTLHCFDYQDMPFDLMLESLQLERTTAYAPLFQVKYLYDISDQDVKLFDDIQAHNENTFAIESQYDITFKVVDGQIYAYYNNALFLEQTINNWLGYYLAICQQVLDNPAMLLADVLEPQLKAQLAPFIQGQSVVHQSHQLISSIEQSAEQWPEKIALVDNSTSLTYQQLSQMFNAVAANLIEVGTLPGTHIAVYLKAGISYVISILGIAKSGAVFIPLDPNAPDEHIDYILDDCDAAIVISDDEHLSELTGYYGLTLDIQSLSEYQGSLQAVCFPDIHPHHSAYLLYTSGSTGRPKGVKIAWASLDNLCHWYSRFSEVNQQNNHLLIIAISFDASIKEILSPLMNGAQLVIADIEVFDPDYLLGLIDEHQIAHVNMVPSAAYALLAQDKDNDYRRLSPLRFVAFGGEPLNLAQLTPWLRSKNCQSKIANVYGPTECTDISTAYINDKQHYLTHQQTPIGRPIDNVCAYIVDSHLKLCPPGVVGELLIGGVGVGQGYQNNLDETQSRFIDSEISDTKIYRSGDYCRYDNAGNIHYIGRKDGQIKIRGKRVEIDQINHHIGEFVGNKRSVVQLCRKDGFETLVAFIQGTAEPGQDVETIRAYLQSQLPLYMVPQAFFYLPKFATNANGKTDIKALEQYYVKQKHQTDKSIECQLTPYQQRIAEVWSEVLGTGQIHPNDNFFNIGGDSILSIQMVSTLKSLGFQCSVYDTFKYPQFKRFCDALAEQSHATTDLTAVEYIAPFAQLDEAERKQIDDEYEDAYPLTYLQQGMLFHSELSQSHSLYHDVFAFKLSFSQDFNCQHFVTAIEQVCAQHPSLRTVFDMHSHPRPLQLVKKAPHHDIRVNSLLEQNAEQQHCAIAQTFEQLKATPFDLRHDPLIRFTLNRLNDKTIVLIIDSHHAIIDGWSAALINRQIYENYKAIGQGQTLTPAKASPSVNFSAYVAKQQAAADSENNRLYWQNYLKDAHSTPLAPHKAFDSNEFGTIQVALGNELDQAIADFCQQQALPPKSLFLAAHLGMLALIAGDSKPTTGIVENGRFESVDGAELTGLFLNTLPLYTPLEGQSWQAVMGQLNDLLTEHKAYRDYPFSQMIQNHPQLNIDALFNFINFHVLKPIADEGQLDATVYGDLFEQTNFKLSTTVSGNIDDGFNLALSIGFAASANFLSVLQRLYCQLLLDIIANYHQPKLLLNKPQEQLKAPSRQSTSVDYGMKFSDGFDRDSLKMTVDSCLDLIDIQQASASCRFDADTSIDKKSAMAVHQDTVDNDTVLRFAAQLDHLSPTQIDALFCQISMFYCAISHSAPEQIALQQNSTAPWRSLNQVMALLKAQEYWQQQLTALPSAINLGHKTSPHGTIESVSHSMPDSLTRAIEHTTADHQLTPYALVHSALAVMLSHYSAVDDILIMAQLDADATLLPLRVNCGAQTVAQFFEHIAQVHHLAQRHDSVNLNEPLFDNLMATAHEPLLSLIVLTHNLPPQHIERKLGERHLLLNLAQTHGTLTLQWHYQNHHYDRAKIAQLAEHLERLLHAMTTLSAEQMAHSPKALTMLSQAELTHLIHTLNDSQQHFRTDLSFAQLFETQVIRTPSNLAAAMGQQQLSYTQLNKQANRLAGYLSEQGVGPAARVGVCLPSTTSLIVAIVATLKVGAAYVPMDPDYPAERLHFLIEDAQLSILLCQSMQLESLDSVCKTIPYCAIDTPQFEQLLDTYSDENVRWQEHYDPDAALYMVYTSGSTGQPKGTPVSGKNATNLLSWYIKHYDIQADDRVLVISAIGFDLTQKNLLAPLLAGAGVYFDNALEYQPQNIVNTINEQQITMVNCAPSALYPLIEQAQKQHYLQLSSLRLTLLGGEAIDLAKLRHWLEHVDCQLVNMYGPTECSDIACAYTFTQQDWHATTLPIGKPSANVRLYVLEPQKEGQPARYTLVPFGTPGELYIGGAGVTQGYFNRPLLSDARFVNVSLNDEPAQRLYRTGDLVRWLPEGNLQFLSRVDEQFKLRGQRIEPQEIEQQLASLAPVHSCAVVLTQTKQPQLCAYIVCHKQTSGEPSTQKIRQQLLTRLPAYMVPSLITILPSLPLTPNGKVDRKALAAKPVEVSKHAYCAATTTTEIQLVEIWAEQLEIDPQSLSVKANFFELGGHSLVAVKLINAIRRQFAQQLPLRLVFDCIDLAQMAEVIDAQRYHSEAQPIERCDRSEPLALSSAQQRLWFIHQYQHGSSQYNMPTAFEVDAGFDVAVANEAMNRLVKRHEILRTVYAQNEDGPIQQIRNDIEFNIQVHDLSLSEPQAREQQLAALISQQRHQSFDLSNDLMVRTVFAKTHDSGRGILLFNVHHIAFDGWSKAIMIEEFATQYRSVAQGVSDNIPPLALQYADFAHWQNQQLSAQKIQSSLDYWQTKLQGIPAEHSLPRISRAKAQDRPTGALVSAQLNRQCADKLQQLATTLRMTPFMLLHSALALVLSRHSYSNDIVLGTAVANRTHPSVAPLIGFFVNTLVLRVDTDHSSLSDYLAHVRQVNLEAQSHQDVPFEYLVSQYHSSRNDAATPLFQIMFSMDTNEQRSLELGQTNIRECPLSEVMAKFDLDINAQINQDGISFDWIYNQNFFTEHYIQTLSEHLLTVVTAIVETPSAPLAKVPMLSQAEQAHLLYQLNQPLEAPAQLETIDCCFSAMAQAVPNNIALVFEDQTLSYVQLNQQANRLAHYLQSHKIASNTLVGVCIDRSIDLVVAILAILKAGAAYVPLDPDYPDERLRYLIEDAQLKHILVADDRLNNLSSEVDFATYHPEPSLLEQFSDAEPIKSAEHNEHSLAYVIYTSGTTGQPKGVMQTHKNLTRLFSATQAEFSFNSQDVWCLFHSTAFDFSVWELWGALMHGGKLVIASKQCTVDTHQFADLCLAHGVTVLNQTPSAFALFTDVLIEQRRQPQSMRYIIFGGEALKAHHIMPWSQRFGLTQPQLVNMYGITETTVHASFKRLELSDLDNPSIGTRLNDQSIYLLDEQLNPVPFGAVGEVFIGGAGLAKGYLNRPELTAERFLDNPFALNTTHNARLYRSGDLARRRENGELEYIGRKDRQVKIRGFRIELGEIEYQLSNLESVKAAAVISHTNSTGDQQLVAYVVYHQQTDNQALKQQLQQRLPQHFMPALIIALDHIPLTKNGKIDTGALPTPEVILEKTSYVAPQNDNERLLASLWSELLSLPQEKISTDANFFELGGHSLLLVRLISAIERETSIKLDLRQVFAQPSIRETAQLIQFYIQSHQVEQHFSKSHTDEIERVEF